MKLESWLLIRKLSLGYFAIVALLLVASLLVLWFVEYGAKPSGYVGCYATDALVIGFECTGFKGAQMFEHALNYPLYHLYVPLFIVWRPALIFVAAAMWFFPVMFLIANKKVSQTHV
jgi:hypothetical protein